MTGGIDAHCHLDLLADPVAAMERARAVGIDGAVVAGADPADWERLVAVAQASGCAWTVGVHPWWADTPQADAAVARLDTHPLPHGLGECGLDHVRARSDAARARQLAVLRPQLRLALHRDVPVVLHCVRAWHVLAVELRAAGVRNGVVHAWTGSVEQTREAAALGLHLGIGPDVLRSARTQAAVRAIPDAQLLLETDAPDRPIPGARQGEPAHLIDVAEAVAALRDTDTRTLLALTGENARRLFRYPPTRRTGRTGSRRP